MKFKRNALILLIIGILLLLAGFLTPIVYRILVSDNGATGIIGGANAPSYIFMLNTMFSGLPAALGFLGVGLAVSSCFCLVFNSTVRKYCGMETSAISLGLSAVGALGIMCFLVWYWMAALGASSEYPIRHPVSIILGILCFIAFVVLIVIYIKKRKANRSAKGLIIDILTSIVYFPAFFFCFSCLYNLV
ncbi:MAG: hypothetical protein PUC05_06185 [Firmicutes bacterium]|nr:hypothetical protein [Bacillota bacterium]